jgi:hypothetical protein
MVTLPFIRHFAQRSWCTLMEFARDVRVGYTFWELCVIRLWINGITRKVEFASAARGTRLSFWVFNDEIIALLTSKFNNRALSL